MRARIIFIILLMMTLIFALWPTAIGVGAEWYGRMHGCEVDFNRAIPCTINGEEWGQSIYEMQKWAYLSLYTIPVGGMLLLGWLVLAVIVIISRVRRGNKLA